MPQIRTFCRIKPTAEYYPEFEVSHDTLSLRVPELLRDYNNSKANNRTTVHHEFHFNYIFKNIATQEEVFDMAAKDIVAGEFTVSRTFLRKLKLKTKIIVQYRKSVTVIISCRSQKKMTVVTPNWYHYHRKCSW